MIFSSQRILGCPLFASWRGRCVSVSLFSNKYTLLSEYLLPLFDEETPPADTDVDGRVQGFLGFIIHVWESGRPSLSFFGSWTPSGMTAVSPARIFGGGLLRRLVTSFCWRGVNGFLKMIFKRKPPALGALRAGRALRSTRLALSVAVRF